MIKHLLVFSLDSNHYDGDASAVTFGLDKRFGNIVIGLAYTTFDSDIDVKVNDGNISKLKVKL